MRTQAGKLPADLSGVLLIPWFIALVACGYWVVQLTPRAESLTSSVPAYEVRSVAPAPFLHLTTSAGKALQVRFRWELRLNGQSITSPAPAQTLELSDNPNFTGPATKVFQVTDSRSREAVLTVPIGQSFWRLHVGNESLGETRVLWIEETKSVPAQTGFITRDFVERSSPEIRLKTPAPGQTIYDRDVDLLAFSWHGRKLSPLDRSFYQLELSRSRDFKGARNVRSRDGHLSARHLGLSPGSYYWRVRLVSEKGSTLELSVPSSFEISKSPPPLPPRSSIQVDSNE